MRILFRIFLAAAYEWDRVVVWWSSIDDPAPATPLPMFWGWCVECDKPGLVTKHWQCERCGSASVINVRAGGGETVRA